MSAVEMDQTQRAILEEVGSILERELGERWGDGYTVMDVIIGYAEPGYGGTDSIIALGDWNPRRFPREGDAPLTDEENIGPRLAEMLEEAGAELEWYDEWTRCGDCYRAMRTQPDSYNWKMFGAWSESACDCICSDCLRADMDTALEDGYIDNPDNAVTWASPADMIAAGWTQYAPDDPHTYEIGWHPGQTDDPHRVLDSIRDDMGADTDVVFLIDSVGQFDMRFSAWARDAED